YQLLTPREVSHLDNAQQRAEALSALSELKKLGVNSMMLTGGNPRAAAVIAAKLNIDYRAGLLPAHKSGGGGALGTP
ncbi:hypothetical protein, partial [Pantoea sp. GbtcB22]|uniref:hypothetical protein n=1 Tax=Pantoea sp. GbtcB22 TaxID=2824767 RepID=UPI001C310ACF